MRLIDSDDLIQFLIINMEGSPLHRAEHIVNEMPTVDPVRHGMWIRDEFGARCSDCGLYAYRDKFDKPWESPYCPNCGAKMDNAHE